MGVKCLFSLQHCVRSVFLDRANISFVCLFGLFVILREIIAPRIIYLENILKESPANLCLWKVTLYRKEVQFLSDQYIISC